MTTLWDLSRIFQRKIERKLAGYAMIYPLHAFQTFRKVEGLMLDEIAIGWLRYLILKECDLIALEKDEKISLIYHLASSWEDGAHLTKLINGMNHVYRDYEPVHANKGALFWSHYSFTLIGEDLANRIMEQNTFRSGLQDLTSFAVGYLEGTYAR